MTWRSVARTILQVIPDRTVVPVLSGPLRGAWWVKGSGNASYWLGTYEAKKQRAFFRSLHEADIVFDIGAHAGFYTLLASRAVGIRGKIVAFEPLPRNLAFLKRHCELNHCGNVKIIEAAVSDRSGTAYFDTKEDSFSGLMADKTTDVQVKTTSLDDFISVMKCPVPNVIKIDVEGAESAVLHGATNTIRTGRPILFIAIHTDANRAECQTMLVGFGYDVVALDGFPLAETSEILATPKR
ncbi:MAG: FkbM family methyltransferase [bacterium]|nr:FkbM family methyltransferase [bacterium]